MPAVPGPAFGGVGVCVSRARLNAAGAGERGAAAALPRRRRACCKRAGRMPAIPGPAFGGASISVQTLGIAAVSPVRSGRGGGGRGAVAPGGCGALRGSAGPGAPRPRFPAGAAPAANVRAGTSAVPGPAFGGASISVQALGIAAVSPVRVGGGRGAFAPGGSGGRLRGIAGLRRARGGRTRFPAGAAPAANARAETGGRPGPAFGGVSISVQTHILRA